MQKKVIKVGWKIIKKIISFILSLVIITGMLIAPLEVHAATLDSTAGIVAVASGNLNVRRYGSTSSSVIASLRKGDYVTLIAEFGSWWLVEYGDGNHGYCHSDYITPLSSSATTVNVDGSLNVRSGAGTSYSKTASLQKGDIVVVLSSLGGWSRILYHGNKTGYVSTQYLSSYSPSSGYRKISLDVPDFKQTDRRWAGVKIGSSGKTIAQIGCVTTGIAMMESYRTGVTKYPDAMSRKLNYSSSGDVYWPIDYVPTYNNVEYLKKIYAILEQGKPVLMGAKTSSGGQHWIVITGYNGDDTLSESGFIINDPASYSRTNLKQFFNAYPIFYKYFYYE